MIRGADNVELKLTAPESDHRSAVEGGSVEGGTRPELPAKLRRLLSVGDVS